MFKNWHMQFFHNCTSHRECYMLLHLICFCRLYDKSLRQVLLNPRHLQSCIQAVSLYPYKINIDRQGEINSCSRQASFLSLLKAACLQNQFHLRVCKARQQIFLTKLKFTLERLYIENLLATYLRTRDLTRGNFNVTYIKAAVGS